MPELEKIKIAWSRKAKGASWQTTTDKEGYFPYEFSFVGGEKETVEVKRFNNYKFGDSSCYQEKLFASELFLTEIEVWATRDGRIYLFANPSQQIKDRLSRRR